MKKLSLCFLVVLALLAAGCGAKDAGSSADTTAKKDPVSVDLTDAVLGVWSMALDASAVKDPEMRKKIEESSLTNPPTMDLRAGGKAVLFAEGKTEDGSWVLEGDTLKVTDETGKVVNGKLSADKKRVDVDMKIGDSGVAKDVKVYFVKK